MKKLQYKSKKWDLKKQEIINNNYYEAKEKEVREIEKQYTEGVYDPVKYCLMMANCLKGLVNYQYILGINRDRQEDIMKIYEAIKKAYSLYENGVHTTKVVVGILKKDEKRELAAYYAIAGEKFELAKDILNQESTILKLLNEDYSTAKRMCSLKKKNKTDTILNMIYAICDKDDEALEDAVYERIIEIRKQPIEYMVIVDIWSIALLKIAEKREMKAAYHFIELDI